MDYAALVTSLQAQATSAIAAAVPFIVVVLGATIGYRLVRRFTK